jgi:hypothetical protein
MIRVKQQRIRAQRFELRRVSKFGIEMSSSQKLLGVDTIFVHGCTMGGECPLGEREDLDPTVALARLPARLACHSCTTRLS